VVLFFFKQKTAYEIRNCDWSSDVCSSDLMIRFSNWIKAPTGTITKFKVNKEKVKKIFDKAKKEKRPNLLEEEGQEILKAYGLPLPSSALATSEAEAVKTATKIGYPVVLKIASPQIIHKSDAGGVKVNLTNDSEIKDAFKTILKNASGSGKNVC